MTIITLFITLFFYVKTILIEGFLFFTFQGNHACNVETSKIQVHILVGYIVRFYPNHSIGFCRLLGIRGPAPQPFQCLLSPP